MIGLIENIQREAISNRWANNKGAQFEYDNEKNHYRLIELTPDCNNYLVGRTQRNDNNCPVIAKGFIAYLIKNWGKSEQLIFDSFHKSCLNRFKQIEAKKPGSSMRNLDNEFYPIHIRQEKEFVTFSKQLKPFLSDHEIELINQFVIGYFKYIEQVFSPNNSTKEKSKGNQNENKLSVPDWCIIFYYLDEAGSQHIGGRSRIPPEARESDENREQVWSGSGCAKSRACNSQRISKHLRKQSNYTRSRLPAGV